jgi:hypothetical protein
MHQLSWQAFWSAVQILFQAVQKSVRQQPVSVLFIAAKTGSAQEIGVDQVEGFPMRKMWIRLKPFGVGIPSSGARVESVLTGPQVALQPEVGGDSRGGREMCAALLQLS